jgi:uncharacterized protein (TIGR02284 family)
METTEKTIEVLNDLIQINNDRAAGLEKAADALDEKDQDLKPVLMKMAHGSGTNSRALASLVSALGGEVEPDSSFKGNLHRTWLQVEAFFSGSDRATILTECERGEDAIKQAYQNALAQQNEIEAQVAGGIKAQVGTINSDHDLIKTLRDKARAGDPYNPVVDGENKYENNFEPAGQEYYQEQQSNAMPDNNTIIAEDETDEQFDFDAAPKIGLVPEPDFTYDNNYKAEQPEAVPADNSKLKEFFVNELKDLLWAENKLVDTLPKMADAAHSVHLREAFIGHLAQTKQHVARLEQIFGVLGEEPDTTKCDAMAGIVDEGEDIIDDTDEGTAQRDVGLIFAGQKVEHYEIASYGGMVTLAKTLGYDAAAGILGQTLAEEKEADSMLSQIAENNINYQAAGEDRSE